MWFLVLLLASPVDVSADRLELDAQGWRAEHVVIRRGEMELRCPTATQRPTASCPEGEITATGPLTLKAPGLRGEAQRLRLCPSSLDTIDAEGLRFTRCTCDDPPWQITARRVEVTPDERLTAEWPVLWIGPVPVAAAPRWWIPLAPRRSGLLPPHLGVDGEDGPHAQLPVFITMGPSADLTLSPGYRTHHGGTADARLRWASSTNERGVLSLWTIPSEGFVLEGTGSRPFGAARLSLDGTYTTHEAVWRTLSSALDQRRRDHLSAEASVAVATPGLAVGLRGAQLRDLRAPEDAPGATSPLPTAWLAWYQTAGPVTIHVGASTTRLVTDLATDPHLADLALEASALQWLGPIRLRPRIGLAEAAYVNGPHTGQRQSGFAAVEAQLTGARRFESIRHEVRVVVDARHARAGITAGAPPVLRPLDRPLDSHAAGLTLSQSVHGPSLDLRLDLRGEYEAEAPIAGWMTPILALDMDTPWLRFTGAVAGRDAGWGTLEAGVADGPHVSLHAARLQLDDTSPWRRDRGAQRALGYAAALHASDSPATQDAIARAAGLGLDLPFGPLRLHYALSADPELGQILGQEGAVSWWSACECWSARINLTHQRGRDAPDIWLALALDRI